MFVSEWGSEFYFWGGGHLHPYVILYIYKICSTPLLYKSTDICMERLVCKQKFYCENSVNSIQLCWFANKVIDVAYLNYSDELACVSSVLGTCWIFMYILFLHVRCCRMCCVLAFSNLSEFHWTEMTSIRYLFSVVVKCCIRNPHCSLYACTYINVFQQVQCKSYLLPDCIVVQHWIQAQVPPPFIPFWHYSNAWLALFSSDCPPHLQKTQIVQYRWILLYNDITT